MPQLAATRAISRAHEAFVAGRRPQGVRPVVLASWVRSLSSGVDPDVAMPPVDVTDEELARARSAHPLQPFLPVVRRLLVADASAAGMLVAISDAGGRLLWVEGDDGLRGRAEGMNFVPGARWGEESAGTNAPGLALALDREVAVYAGEHFARNVAPWSCAAAPIHDPATGLLLGVLDLTGGDAVAAPHTLALVRATVAAVEGELRLAQLQRATPRRRARAASWRLAVLGRDRALLRGPGGERTLSPRHSELLLLLAAHPAGLNAEQLGVLLHDDDAPLVTMRAELSRLRVVAPDLALASRPYRLGAAVRTDADDVRALLDRGCVRRAVGAYAGPLLPRSDAPGVRRAREELRAHLRAAVLGHPDPDVVLAHADSDDGREDWALWQAALAALPQGSPRRAAVLGHLDRLRSDLA